MAIGARGEVNHDRLMAVDCLQQQKVGDFSGSAPSGRHGTRGQCVASLMQEPLQLGQESREALRGATLENCWNERVVKNDVSVRAALHDVRQRNARKTRSRVTL